MQVSGAELVRVWWGECGDLAPSSLPALASLDLSHNNLSLGLQLDLTSLPGLTQLSLAQRSLVSLGPHHLALVPPSLTSLDLSSAPLLQEIQEAAFTGPIVVIVLFMSITLWFTSIYLQVCLS